MNLIPSHIKLFILLLVFPLLGYSTTWHTVSNGYWGNGNTWSGSGIPDYHTEDTIIISHPVFLDNNLVLFNQAFLQIEEDGGLCGHQRLDVLHNAHLQKFGILELDTLNLQDSAVVELLAPGSTVLTLGAVISGASYMTSSSPMSVGPWFDCIMPEYGFMDIHNYDEVKINVYPNPASEKLFIELVGDSKGEVSLLDIHGKLIYKSYVEAKKAVIDLSPFEKGVYFVWIKSAMAISNRKIVVQ